jgi:hypothetical protein
VKEKADGKWTAVEDDEDEESPFDAAPEGSLAVFEGGDDDPVHILSPCGGSNNNPTYYIPSQAYRALKPGGGKGRTKRSRATVLELARGRGYAVEQKKNGEWVGLELEGAAEAEGAEETG